MNTIIGFLFVSIRAGTPLLFATTGEILTEKSGSLNLGVEGMMAVGAIGGYYFGCRADSFPVATLASLLCAALCALIYAFLTITLQANQNVTGLALTTFGIGLYQFVGRSLTNTKTFPSLSDSPAFKAAAEDGGIPLLRDIPYLGKLLFSYNVFVYLALLAAVAVWFYMVKTHAGLKLRSVGENPGAADACGVNVTLTRYANTVLGGGICGIGGLYLALVTNGGAWNGNWINGKGWIAVALVIFANWNPVKAIFGSYFFGMLETLQSWKGNLADAFPKVLGPLDRIPTEFYQLLPFLITAAVIVVSSTRKKRRGVQPAACGTNYYREER